MVLMLWLLEYVTCQRGVSDSSLPGLMKCLRLLWEALLQTGEVRKWNEMCGGEVTFRVTSQEYGTMDFTPSLHQPLVSSRWKAALCKSAPHRDGMGSQGSNAELLITAVKPQSATGLLAGLLDLQGFCWYQHFMSLRGGGEGTDWIRCVGGGYRSRH